MKKRTNARLQRQQQKKARHAARRQEKKRLTAPTQSRGKAMVCELFKTLNHFFPDLFEQLRQIEDCQRRSDYALSEILMAAIALFIDETLPLPKGISCNNFDDLKHLLVKVATVILVILFLEKAIEWQGGWEILGPGAAMALMIAAATWSTQNH